MKVRVIAEANMKDHQPPEQPMHQNHNHLHQCRQHNHNLQHDDDDFDDIQSI